MPLTRRQFLGGIGATVGGAGFAAAGYEKLIPYLVQPEDITPGKATWYATSCRECPAGCGMLLRCRESRVVKCEGNPQHPINRGKLCARGQAALNALYDPDRLKGPKRRSSSGELVDTNWDDAIKAVGHALAASNRIALISDLQTGSLDALMRSWLSALGSDRLVVYEPIDYAGVKYAYREVVPHFNMAGSDCLISFGCDFLETWVSPVEYAREFAQMRRVNGGKRAKFIYVGPRLSATASMADIRILVPPGAAAEVASALNSELDVDSVASDYGIDPAALGEAARCFAAAQSPLALPGWDLISALAARRLNTGRSEQLIETNRPHAVTHIAAGDEVTRLLGDMASGKVDTLIVHGSNPAYSLPGFAEAVKGLRTVVSLTSFLDETTAIADWALPSNTPLESWGDYEPYPDVANLMQPTMERLFDTRQTGDILIELAKRAGVDVMSAFGADNYYAYLRKRWGVPLAAGSGPDKSAPDWEAMVAQGGRWGSAVSLRPLPSVQAKTERVPQPTVALREGRESLHSTLNTQHSTLLKLWAYPHIFYYDGRGANRRWLQETPEPMVKGVWSSWAELHPDTADKLGISTDDVIEITAGGKSIRVSAYVWPGVARDTIAVPMGQGHTQYGGFAEGIGVNVFPLLGDSHPERSRRTEPSRRARPELSRRAPIVEVKPTGKSKWFTRIKGSTDQHDREIVQTTPLSEPARREHPIVMPLPSGYTKRDFYPPHKYKDHRWAMVVDLDKCIGCHACVTACYAENNIGIVGPEEVWRRREMSWIRIDRYFDWSHASDPVLFQPMLCQHCDAAPCEPVCPVFAAAHSDDGLNMQVYNRCVGTRYCSHNCPYKVRRFNWFDYTWPEPMNWQLNPDVTVRCRGVMEKCTFCVQRIREAEIVAKSEGRKVRDGEVAPACVQTCPTGVFTFGDLMDERSRVSELIRTDPRAYQVLSELNTKTAVIYLKRIVEGAS